METKCHCIGMSPVVKRLLSFKNNDTFVKENHRLSRERVIAFARSIYMFGHVNFAIYVLDDYAVHLMLNVEKAFWNRGYILVIIGGGITGFVQVNDTHLHEHLKSEYRKKA